MQSQEKKACRHVRKNNIECLCCVRPIVNAVHRRFKITGKMLQYIVQENTSLLKNNSTDGIDDKHNIQESGHLRKGCWGKE